MFRPYFVFKVQFDFILSHAFKELIRLNYALLQDVVFFTCAFCLLSFFVKDLNHLFLRYGLGMVIFGCSFFYSLCLMRSVINLSLAGLLSKFWGRKPGK